MPALNFETVSLDEITQNGLTAEPSPHRPVILVVDDERVIADTLAAILARRGFAAMQAYDAESALDLSRVIPPELLLSDVLLPGKSGIELAIAMKDAVPDCRVLLFSGQDTTVDLLAAARDAGHDITVLAKPVHPVDLLANIRELDAKFRCEPPPELKARPPRFA
ncbi:MAG TPA: response regulator [Acidobacteriaceae bacterium]|jgi:DNA-binding response OmpR family regulator|nr:response regulator [Acidobacteriaceae bacterium]